MEPAFLESLVVVLESSPNEDSFILPWDINAHVGDGSSARKGGLGGTGSLT